MLLNIDNQESDATRNTTPIDFMSFLNKSSASMAMQPDGIRGYFGSNDRLVYQDFPSEEIARVHPDLPGVIQVRFYQQHNPENLLPTAWVLLTLSYWNDPLTLKTTDGRTVAIGSVNNVKAVYDKTAEAQLDVTKYKLSFDQDTMFVVNTAWTGIFVSFAELERLYPSWKSRYDLLMSLGAPMEELVSAVFVRETRPVKAVNLEGVDFE